ncbi:hypothetical protein [Winogradskyella immobilis]|uniref:Secreted protein n=1 Tax=Winogradskyella immobilis TaxID=2816852 RepID=A0ABS8ERZ4_9FLAO|nr:hypothetical protein [Winogradskyella immobilis]MCC1485082.1 hypothetical protein [Winogradskyella immobilis]MCG0017174.1 hypothetical protein [Winogradskyella immobilis]
MLKRILFLFCALAFGFTLNAQGPDKEKKSIRIPAVKSKKEKDSTPNRIKVAPKKNPKADNKDKAKNAGEVKEKKKYVIKESERPFSMTYNDGLRSAGEIFEERWNKQAQRLGIRRVMSDQFLGEHKIDSKFVNIVARDHEVPDGDRVSVTVNDELIYENVLLTGSYRRLRIDLKDGRNQIDIKALNQGTHGPNTAEFIVFDDKGSTVSSKEWNLLTGVKATIVFINEKVTITRKTAEN